MARRFCFSLLNIFLCILVHSQDLVTIEGNIKDETSLPVRYASVYLLNTNFRTLSDSLGRFALTSVSPGAYIIAISATGYATIDENIQLTKGGKISFDFRMVDVSKQLDEVIVTAEKKEENLQTIPSAISVLSSRNINDYRLWNSRDLTAVVPNLYSANPGDGRNVTSIR